MEGNYPVYLGTGQVGGVRLTRQGLYACLQCTCGLTGEIMYRLWAETESGERAIGLLIPEGRGFGLRKKLPAKHLAGSGLRFFIRAKKELGDSFIPLSPEKPFAYLSRLEEAFLRHRDGETGITFTAPE